MELHRTWLEYAAGQWRGRGYLARPARVERGLPAVIVIQEIWGVDGHIRDVTERLATAGYLALAPDLWALGDQWAALQPERIEAAKGFLDSLPPGAWGDPTQREAALQRRPERERGEIAETLGALFAPRDMARLTAALRAAVAYVRALPECAGQQVGSVGFCMGGQLSALLACEEPALSAAVIFYGSSPDASRVAGIACPVLGLYGGDDHPITDGVPAFAQAMRAAGKRFEHRVYPGAPHAFFNDTRPSYRLQAARDAWARTLWWFAEHLTAPA